jgi:broad specificity phosphatase PhoE
MAATPQPELSRIKASPAWVRFDTLVNLIRGQSGQSWQDVYDRVRDKAEELDEQAKLAGARLVMPYDPDDDETKTPERGYGEVVS